MARILYFATLVNQLGRSSEDVDLPLSVTDARTLLAWLRGRGEDWSRLLQDDRVRVTVNKQFATPETKVSNKDEIALVPARL